MDDCLPVDEDAPVEELAATQAKAMARKRQKTNRNLRDIVKNERGEMIDEVVENKLGELKLLLVVAFDEDDCLF